MLRVQRFPAAPVEQRIPGGTHRAGVARVLDHLAEPGHAGVHLLGAGHRVVHGGERFTSSIWVDDAVIAAVRSFSHLAPLHNLAHLAGIDAVRALLTMGSPRWDGLVMGTRGLFLRRRGAGQVAVPLVLRQRLLGAARTQADRELAGSMEGHAAMDITIASGALCGTGSGRGRLFILGSF